MLKFKFDANQPYQLQAIQSVTALFKQQVYQPPEVSTWRGVSVISNFLQLDDSLILENLKTVQQQNGLDLSPELKSRDFSVEMETGTGKTYVYLRTILELKKQYGFRKFIIIVPSIAIREGVLKTLQITEEHFSELYDGQAYRYSVYQSKMLSRLRQFALGNSVEILIMTIDSFNKDSNVIHNYTDRLAGARPIDLVQGTRPIVILDEPQNMESEKARQAIQLLNPLFVLRYSATHRYYYNLVYRLTPFDAYRMGLVKQIEVYSITEIGNRDQTFIVVNDIFRKNGKLLTKIQLNTRDRIGAIKQKVLQFKSGDSLYSKTKLPVYENWIISEINLKEKKIGFSNGQILRKGRIFGSDRILIMKKQIDMAIRNHLERKEKLRRQGIKNLTLFFIDRVDNYLNQDSWIRNYFEEQFERITRELKISKMRNVSEIHEGYFSKKKTEKAIEQDKEAFDLIMRDKERLLSLDEPVEFIFSHSALREGWDNPNVFNICTLNYSHSQIKKRQEIGRGIRLCVNQNGERIFDPEVNRLTVIANENYADYVAGLQTEYNEEYGSGVPKPEIRNARLRRIIKPKKDLQKNSHFVEIWDKISCKTVFNIQMDNKAFQEECVIQLNKIKVISAGISVTRAKADLRSERFRASVVSQKVIGNGKKFPVQISSIINEIEAAIGLTKQTIVNILTKCKTTNQLQKNPEQFLIEAIQIIRNALAIYIKEGISYKSINSKFDLNGFKPFEDYENQLIEAKKTIYPSLSFSNLLQKEIIQQLESEEKVLFYLKMPSWFAINTPYGKYSPDWSILTKKGKTKKLIVCNLMINAKNNSAIALKQHCVKKHFNVFGVQYYQFGSSEDIKQNL